MCKEVRLETERLILRFFRESDLEEYAEMFAHPEVMHFLGKPMTKSEAWRNMATQIGHWQLRGFGLWAVEQKETNSMIGRIGCFQPEGWPGFEVGWMLRRDYWGKGYAVEAARAAMDYAFGRLKKARVVSVIHPDNQASVNVAKRLGECYEREVEIAGIKVHLYGIDRAAWESAKVRPPRKAKAVRPHLAGTCALRTLCPQDAGAPFDA